MSKDELHDARVTDAKASGGQLVDSLTGRHDS
jgi:hypothetical protein